MSDPNLISPEALETAKVAGGGGVGMVFMALIQRFFKKAEVDDEREAKALEAVLAKLESISAGVAEVKAKIDVLTERTSTMRADMDKAEQEIKTMLDRLARLEGKFDHLSEQLAK